MEKLKAKLQQRSRDSFYGAKTDILLRQLDPRSIQCLTPTFDEFYEVAIKYIDNWFRLEKFPTNIKWIMLKEPAINYDEVRRLAEQISPDLAEKDELYDEVIFHRNPLFLFIGLWCQQDIRGHSQRGLQHIQRGGKVAEDIQSREE